MAGNSIAAALAQIAASSNSGIGGVISLLWFRRQLPPYACQATPRRILGELNHVYTELID